MMQHGKHAEKGRSIQEKHRARSRGGDNESAKRRSNRAGNVETNGVSATAAESSRTVHQLWNGRLPRRAADCCAETKGKCGSQQHYWRRDAEHRRDPSTVATTTIHACAAISNLRRSTMSASAPAGSARRKKGRLEAVCINATSRGDGASEVMSYAAPVSCIHVPMFDATEASQRERKNGCCSGGSGRSLGSCFSSPVIDEGMGAVIFLLTTAQKAKHSQPAPQILAYRATNGGLSCSQR